MISSSQGASIGGLSPSDHQYISK